MTVDVHESRRRTDASLGSVCSLALLDVLLGLPLGCPIARSDLTPHEMRLIGTAQPGCVEITSSSVTRLLSVPATVVAAIIRGPRWRAAVLRAAAYSAFTQRIVVLRSPPTATAVLEAQYAGFGIWVETEGTFVEHLAPQPFAPRYFKAAGWLFAENAYGAAAAAAGITEVSIARAGARRPVLSDKR